MTVCGWLAGGGWLAVWMAGSGAGSWCHLAICRRGLLRAVTLQASLPNASERFTWNGKVLHPQSWHPGQAAGRRGTADSEASRAPLQALGGAASPALQCPCAVSSQGSGSQHGCVLCQAEVLRMPVFLTSTLWPSTRHACNTPHVPNMPHLGLTPHTTHAVCLPPRQLWHKCGARLRVVQQGPVWGNPGGP